MPETVRTRSLRGTIWSDDRSDSGESVDHYARERAYESVRAVLSDDHWHERGVAGAERSRRRCWQPPEQRMRLRHDPHLTRQHRAKLLQSVAFTAGTGKNHLLVARGVAAVAAGHRVRYFTAAELVEILYRGRPLGDTEMLVRVRERCDTVETRAAGAICLIDAGLPDPGQTP